MRWARARRLLVRCLLTELRKNNIAFGYVFNPLLPVVEFFQYIMADLGLPYAGRTKTEMLLDLNRLSHPAPCPWTDYCAGGG